MPEIDVTARSSDAGSLLESEKALLDALLMTEHEAAKVLGRSRQSLYQAGLAGRRNYFKRNDIISLVFAAKAKTPDLDLIPVYEYVGATREPGVLVAIRSVNAADAEESKLAEYAAIWIVIPDYAYLNRSHPAAMAMLLKLALRPNSHTRFFAANGQDEALIRAAVGRANSIDVQVQTWMGAIPYSIIGDPDGVAECYIFASGRFMRHDWYGGPKLALLLKTLLRKGLILEQELSNSDEHNARAVGG